MMKKTKKRFIITALLCLLLLAQAVFADDSAVSYIRVNNIADRDVEILVTKGGDVLVPFKQLADIFQVEYSAKKNENVINFTTFDGKQGVINSNGIYIDNKQVTALKPNFIRTGIIGVYNEAYIPSDIASLIMGAKIESDYENMTLSAQVDRELPILEQETPESINEYKGPRAHKNVLQPPPQGKFSVDTLSIHSDFRDNRMFTKYQFYQNQSETFTGTTSAVLKGGLLGGEYRIDAAESHYSGSPFNFAGLSATYRNKFKLKKRNYYYELGRVRGIYDNNDSSFALGTQIFGAQLWNYNNEKRSPRDLDGMVAPDSLVSVTINSGIPEIIDTYGGYYSLKDVKMPAVVRSIKIDEVKADGTIKNIFRDIYSPYGNDVPLEGENRFTGYTGVWGYQNRLFREGGDIYKGTNKKFTAAAEHQYGIKDNVTLKTKISMDTIYDRVTPRVIWRLPSNDSLLVSGTSRSANYLEGMTFLNSVNWINRKNKDVRGAFIYGGSISEDIREKNTKGGYIVKAVGSWEKNLDSYTKGFFKPHFIRFGADAFHTSPYFYVASTDGISKNDRTGGRVSTAFRFNSTSIGGSYERYYSNIANRYAGGLIAFDDASVNFGTSIPKVAMLKLSGRFRRGENKLGENYNYNYDAGLFRNLGRYLSFESGIRGNYYNTTYKGDYSFMRGNHSKYSDVYSALGIRLPQKFGNVRLEHDIITYSSGDYRNEYFKAGVRYMFPITNRLYANINTGYKYKGHGGMDVGVSLSYHSETGMTATLGYQFSKNSGYFIDNYYTPVTNSHMVLLTLDNSFIFDNKFLRSVGAYGENKGILDIVAFFDVNKNGVYDKKIDVLAPNIPLTGDWGAVNAKTGKKGRYRTQGLTKGIYNVKLDTENLPFFISPVSQNKTSWMARVTGGKATKVQVPLLNIGGSISGKVVVADDFEIAASVADYVVVVIDSLGKEVKYATLGSDGEFYISGLEPGNYTVKLDDIFVDQYGLEKIDGKSEIKFTIKPDYNNPTEVNGLNLEYKIEYL